MSSDEETPLTPSSDGAESKPARTLPDSDVHFAFGPEKWFWVRCGSRWGFVRSNRSDWSSVGIRDALWVAFKHDTGFVIGGDDEDGGGRIVHSYNDSYMVPASEVDAFVKSRDAYIKLHDWICERCGTDIDKIRDVSVTIGPKGSYFARCGTTWISHALPKDLQSALDKDKDRLLPVHVALGIRGAWILLWSNGTRDWNLRHAYTSLASTDQLPQPDGGLVFAALNPYEEDNYFLVEKNGACSYKASLPSKKESAFLHEMTNDYMCMRAKKDGTTFNHPFTRDGVTSKITITPNSYKETGRMRSLVDTWIERRKLPVRNDVVFTGAVAGSAGIISKMAGTSTVRAMSVAASTGVGAAFALWYRA